MILKIKVADYIRKCDIKDMAMVLLGVAGVKKEEAKQKQQAMIEFLEKEITIDTEKGEML